MIALICAIIIVVSAATAIIWSSSQPSATPQPQYRLVTDIWEREVKVPVNVERVVYLGYGDAEILIALGVWDKIVGWGLGAAGSDYCPSDIAKLLKEINPKYVDIPIVAANEKEVNFEKIVELKPDVVITSATNYEPIAEQLEKYGIPTVCVYMANLNQVYQSIKIIGETLGCEDKAQEYVNYIKETLQSIKDRTVEIPEEEKPKILLIFYRGPGKPATLIGREGFGSTLMGKT
jgi:iron complex transport system substrate-binding protein